MKPNIDASCVVIAYNEQDRLEGCLNSLLCAALASSREVEIVVVDNNSHDMTSQIISSYTDQGVVYVFEERQGVGYARQAGLEVARGNIILSCDADTEYPLKYVDAMVDRLLLNGVSCVFTPYWFMADGRKSSLSLALYCVFRDFSVWVRARKRPELSVGGAAMAFRREEALRVGWRTDIRRGEDGMMLLGLRQFGRARIVLATFVPSVRVRSTSRTLDADGSFFAMIRKRVWRELSRLCAYFKRKDKYEDQNYNKL